MVPNTYASPPHPFTDLKTRDFAAVYLDWSWCGPAQTGKEIVRAWINECGPKFDVFIADGDSEEVGRWMMEQWRVGIRVDDHAWGSLVFVEQGNAIGLIEKINTRNIAFIEQQAERYLKSFIARMGIEPTLGGF